MYLLGVSMGCNNYGGLSMGRTIYRGYLTEFVSGGLPIGDCLSTGDHLPRDFI